MIMGDFRTLIHSLFGKGKKYLLFWVSAWDIKVGKMGMFAVVSLVA